MHKLYQDFKIVFQKWWWSWCGRCDECGGEIEEYSWKIAYCSDCGKAY
ncbi:MAG: hypothetical protein M3Q44_07375 [bacterium]|nr:hypothetical protein [bacterium]